MKSNQVILQWFAIIVVFAARRIPSPAIYRSLATSMIMIMFAITKALMSKQISHTKKPSRLNQFKQLLWIICLAGTIFTAITINLSFLVWGIVCYRKDFNRLPLSMHKYPLFGAIITLTYLVITHILMLKNCFKQHLQTKVRFIIISITHTLLCFVYLFSLSVIGGDTGNDDVAIFVITFFMLNLCLVIVSAKAAFSVSKLNDIWSLEKMTSKELCCIPNLLFVIVVLTFLGFNLIMVLYSLHVFPTFYA